MAKFDVTNSINKRRPDSTTERADGTVPYAHEQHEKLTEWKKEPNLLDLKADLEAAKPSQEEKVASIQKWNDLLNIKGDAKPPKIKNRSTVQPKLIRRQAEWRYPALSEPFLSSERMFKVEPATFEDGPAAKQNELLLNHQFRTQLDRVWLIDNIVRATVDEGTAIIQLGWRQITEKETQENPVFSHFPLNPQDPAAEQHLQMLQQAVELKQADPRTYNEQIPPELQAAVDYLLETGEPTIAIQTGTEQETVDKIIENRPVVELLNPANVYIDPSCEGQLDKALFVIVSFETNKAELEEDGRYKNLDQIIWETNSPMGHPDHATNTPSTFDFKDVARKKVVAYEYWGYYDVQGNGKLTPIVATWIGNTIIRMEENPFPDGKPPFVVIPYLPVKRELYGEPDAEMLEDNQRILGAVTRGIIDLLGRSANAQKGMPKGMLDPLNLRKYEDGRDYEYNTSIAPSQAIIEHTYPDIPNSALQVLQLQNEEAEALTGVKSFSGGLSGESYGRVATAVRGMLDAAAKREMSILRRLAKGITEIGRKIIAMNAVFLSDEEVVRVTNREFVTVKREELVGEFDLIVDISTFEVDNTKAQDLGFMLQTLGPNMDPSIYMTILAEIADLKRMPELAEKLRTWQPQPDPVQEQLKQMELEQKQKEIELLQSEIALNQARAAREQTLATKDQIDAIEQETGTKHARKLRESQAQAQANQNLEVTKALLRDRKPGTIPGNIEAGIGFNELSKAIEEDRLLGN